MKLTWSHCVMYVRDLEATIAFYDEMLGFKVSDRGPLIPGNDELQVAFLTQSGSDHHQIAFANARSGDAPSTTLDHIAFRVESLDDVKEMAARLTEDGRATDIGAVNHGNAWSCYFRDPEGNRIEVFTDSPFHVKQPQIDGWDFAMSEAELQKATEKHFGPEPDFQPMDHYREAQTKKLGG